MTALRNMRMAVQVSLLEEAKLLRADIRELEAKGRPRDAELLRAELRGLLLAVRKHQEGLNRWKTQYERS
jgi:hypothetical protein